ncbi:MAG: LacI family DNA-binding transcriptional regulator [Clostridia bacterium]|nr:LacI family DNA-binding transcriptional regulator [Clostridia bacterium]
MKRLTVKDIARRAGVSVTAVSFVLNNKPGVSEATRKKIQKIIDETDFKPNLNSKKLLLKKSFNICLIINPYSSPFEDLFYFEITRGILNKSRNYDYNIIISRPILSNSELPDIVYSGDADGIIFMQDIPPVLIDKAVACKLPFVIVDSHSRNNKVTSINPDYVTAAFDATNYLIENGHTDIAVVSSKIVPDFYKQTLEGFKSAMSSRALPVKKEYTEIFAEDENSAYEAAKLLFKDPDHIPTAVLCTVYSFAIGVIQYIKEMNLSVPGDVSVIGIDDTLLSRYIEPKLTTVGIDKAGMGSMALDMLFDKINGGKPESISLPMELIVRNSVSKITK